MNLNHQKIMGRKISFIGLEKLDSLDNITDLVTPVELRQNSQLRESISRELVTFISLNAIKNAQSFSLIARKIEKLNSKKKQLFDATTSLFLLLVLFPLMLFIALAIKMESKGPVLFSQNRTGYMGRRFKMYKFRTMVENADKLKAQLNHLNHHDDQSPDFKIKDDPRITSVGRILRKLSLDELPQFFNVIKGDMRLVGPRPTSFPAETYEPSQLPRLLVYPGLTGLWQISGRSNISFEDRVALDCKYILEKNSLLDLKILFQTPRAIIQGNGAY